MQRHLLWFIMVGFPLVHHSCTLTITKTCVSIVFLWQCPRCASATPRPLSSALCKTRTLPGMICLHWLDIHGKSTSPRIMSRPEKCVYEIEWNYPISCKSNYDKAEAKKCLFNNTTTGLEIDLQPLSNYTITTFGTDNYQYTSTVVMDCSYGLNGAGRLVYNKGTVVE